MQSQPPTQKRVRFASFELNCGTGELFQNGNRIKLQDQPARLLMLLVLRAGSLVKRDEIQEALWEDGQFVEFEHAINVAVKKIREALGDDPVKPKLLETLPRRGYRFIAAVEFIEESIPAAAATAPETETESAPGPEKVQDVPVPQQITPKNQKENKETVEPEFALPALPARMMFLAVQLVYLTVYTLTLVRMSSVKNVLDSAGIGWLTVPLLMGAAGSIPVRLYLIFTVGLGHPAAGRQYRRMLPYLMPWDWLWAPSPFLAIHAIGPEWALVLTAMLVYPPISQLILMRSIDHHQKRSSA